MPAGRNTSLLPLIAVVLIGMTGFGVFLPIFPFLALHVGASPTTATIAMGAYSFGQLIAAPLWGRLSDRVGRKPVLLAGLIGGVISYVLLAQAESVIALGAARLFGGLMAGNVGAAFAAAADLADERTRARNMGLLGAAVGFGFIAGPFFGAMLIGEVATGEGFARVCYASAAFGAVAALMALLLFRETHPPEARRDMAQPRVRATQVLTSKPLLARFAAVMLLMIAAQALMETTFGLWAEDVLAWGPREVGWTLAALGVGAAVLQGGGAGRAARMLGERMTLLIGLVLCAAGFGGLAVAGEVATMAAGLAALMLGLGLAQPALQSLIALQASGDDRGAVMGISQSAAALGRVLGPLGAGALFDAFNPGAPFVAGALVLLAALFFAVSEPAPAQSSPSRG